MWGGGHGQNLEGMIIYHRAVIKVHMVRNGCMFIDGRLGEKLEETVRNQVATEAIRMLSESKPSTVHLGMRVMI